MSLSPTKRRVLIILTGLAGLTLGVALLARQALTGLVVNALLHLAGASEIQFTITEASPWHVVVEDIGFAVRTQAFAAKRVTFTRAHWWTPSLGTVRVEQARVPLTIDGSDTNPAAWATYKNGDVKVTPTQVPLEELSLDGQLVVKAAAQPDQTLTVRLDARLAEKNTWTGKVQADGPGIGLDGEGSFDPARSELTFKLPVLALDLKPWQGFVQRLIVLPGGRWEVEGRFAGSAEGRLTGKEFVASARVQLREGRASNPALAVAAEGIEADLEFTDLEKFITKPGTMRVRELKTGQLVLRDMDYMFAFEGTDKVAITRATFKALGGTVATEPFKYFPALREIETVVLVEGISVAEVMALTQDLPATATGRVNGRFPLRIDDSGLRLGTGWLALQPGVYAEIQFNAGGLLTGGVSPNSPTYAVLKKVESGLLKLKISELRLDIRPPNAPPGRSAQLHLAGEPVDPNVKAPVILDLNVNGPLEKLINLGLDSRLGFGSKP